MLTFTEMRRMARARVQDARALFHANRYDGAVYVIGYAIELSLKARIATSVLAQPGWPESSEEFEVRKNLQTHKLPQLLKASGREARVNQSLQAEWQLITQNWGPEARYRRVGHVTATTASDMINAVERVMKAL